MIITCTTCGHKGEDGKDYHHDCYWVFRERAERERHKLCETCGGNGVIKIPGGVSICDACQGRCWA